MPPACSTCNYSVPTVTGTAPVSAPVDDRLDVLEILVTRIQRELDALGATL
jgi:hypothetical protein